MRKLSRYLVPLGTAFLLFVSGAALAAGEATPVHDPALLEKIRKSDAKTGGGYEDVNLVGGKPEFMNKDGKAANKGGTYWLKMEDKAPFDDSKFVAGDEVASILVAPFTGDRGDIKAGMKWANGKWTIEIARKLVTGSKTDVQFDDLGKAYGFGLAFFDNAQVRHAFVQEPLHLKFDK